MKRRALISVTDKTGVAQFAQGLVDLGFALLSTGGTYKIINEAGVPVEEVAAYTGSPEMMDGRLKTLHPKIHGGILARREMPADVQAMQEHQIDPIDLVVVNLYPFRATVDKPGVARQDVVGNIDIGGPTMIRSAAKNHAHVAVVVDPSDYPRVLQSLSQQQGKLDIGLCRELAGKAFAHTSSYDTAIAAWFDQERAGNEAQPLFGPQVGMVGEKVQDLRYGENPHQLAAFYKNPDASTPSLASAQQLNGKELSYNNILDLDAALALALDFSQPACAIIKHNNPCGTAVASDLAAAFTAALAADPLSAFGGIVAMNQELDGSTAQAMVDKGTFLEAVIAPQVAPVALEILRTAKWGANLRVLSLNGQPNSKDQVLMRQVSGGFLLQTYDPGLQAGAESSVSSSKASESQLATMDFAMRVCKHVKSNAIVLARHESGVCATVGVGAGQMSRVDAVKIAVEKAGALAKGAVLASDAFFPFADGVETAAAAGVAAVIQPGGSKRDDEVIAAADKAGMSMVFTGARYFRH